MTHNDATETYLDNSSNHVTEKFIVVKPGNGKAVGLGIYSSDSNPEYDVTYQPDVHDDIAVTHERLDVPGQARFILLYQFHNFSERACKITLRLRDRPL